MSGIMIKFGFTQPPTAFKTPQLTTLLCGIGPNMLNQIFVTFLSDLFFFFIILLLTPLTTTSYLVTSSQARSYGILKTTCSDRLTCKNRLGSEVGDSTENPGVRRSNDHLLCCNNANPMAIVNDLTILFFTHFSKSMHKIQKLLNEKSDFL